jgi:RecJ-like exonuclease
MVRVVSVEGIVGAGAWSFEIDDGTTDTPLTVLVHANATAPPELEPGNMVTLQGLFESREEGWVVFVRGASEDYVKKIAG